MKTRTVACAALFALAALTGCSDGDGGSIADPAACKTAMAKQFDDAMAAGAETPDDSKRPAACAGLDAKTLEKITGEVVNEYMDSDKAAQDVEDALESAAADPGVTPDPSDLADLEDDLSGIQEELDALESELDAAVTP